jgi:hypothetical protein
MHLMFMTKRWSPVFLGPQGNNAGAGASPSTTLLSSPALPFVAAAAAASGVATCFSAGSVLVAGAVAAAAAPLSSMLCSNQVVS